MKRFFAAVTVFVLLICASMFPAGAANEGLPQIPEDEWNGFVDSVPEDIKDGLFEGMDREGFGDAVMQMTNGEYIIGVVLDVFGARIGGAFRLFFMICAVLIVSAIFSLISESVDNSATASTFRFCSVGVIISVVIYTQYEHFSMIEDFFAKLTAMFSGMIPVSAAVWAMGGNVSTASVGSVTFGVILTVSEVVLSSTLIPVCCMTTVLGFCDSLTNEIRLARIMNAIKKIYNFVLVLVMTVLLGSLVAETALAAAADTTAAKAARLVSGTVIPILGGSVGETFRTVAAGISYIKSIFGIGGILIIAVMVIPVIINLVLTRFAFLICAGIADMLGCSGEVKILDNIGEVYGTMLAVVSGVAVMFIMALYVFMQTVVAVA